MFKFVVVFSQFNYSSGQPAPESITDMIYGNTLSVCSLFSLSVSSFVHTIQLLLVYDLYI